MKNSGEEKKLSFFFSFISEEMGGEGVRVEVWKKRATQQAPKSKIKKESPNKMKTHTENGTPAHELKKKKKKNICK